MEEVRKKIHPVGAEFHSDRMTKPIVPFRKFANVPNNTCPCPLHAGMQGAVELQPHAFLTLMLHVGDS